jgi:hypothetical protein
MQTVISQDTEMQMNYYNDENCTEYNSFVNVTTGALTSCMESNITGAASFNVTNCYTVKQYTGCQCTWWSEANCQGQATIQVILADGSPLNTYLGGQLINNVLNCGQNTLVSGAPKSFSCAAGFYVF